MSSKVKARHICSYCPKSYSRADHKVRHERSHSITKQFRCYLSSRQFARRDLLQRHTSIVHKLVLTQRQEQLKNEIMAEHSASTNEYAVNSGSDTFSESPFKNASIIPTVNSAGETLDNLVPADIKTWALKEVQKCLLSNNNKSEIPSDLLTALCKTGDDYILSLKKKYDFNLKHTDGHSTGDIMDCFISVSIGSLLTNNSYFNEIFSSSWEYIDLYLNGVGKDAQVGYRSFTVLLFLMNEICFSENILDNEKMNILMTRLFNYLINLLSSPNINNSSADTIFSTETPKTKSNIYLTFNLFTLMLRYSLDSNLSFIIENVESVKLIYNWFLSKKGLVNLLNKCKQNNNIGTNLELSNLDKIDSNCFTNILYCELFLDYPNFYNKFQFDNAILILLKLSIYSPESENKVRSNVELMNNSTWILLEVCWLEFLNSYTSQSIPDSVNTISTSTLLNKWFLSESLKTLICYSDVDLKKLSETFALPTMTIISLLFRPSKKTSDFSTLKHNSNSTVETSGQYSGRQLPLILDVVAFQIKILETEIKRIFTSKYDESNLLTNQIYQNFLHMWIQLMMNDSSLKQDDPLYKNFIAFFFSSVLNGQPNEDVTNNKHDMLLMYHHILITILKYLKTNCMMSKLITTHRNDDAIKSIMIELWEEAQSVVQMYWTFPKHLELTPIQSKQENLSCSMSNSSQQLLAMNNTFNSNAQNRITPFASKGQSIEMNKEGTLATSINNKSALLPSLMMRGAESNSMQSELNLQNYKSLRLNMSASIASNASCHGPNVYLTAMPMTPLSGQNASTGYSRNLLSANRSMNNLHLPSTYELFNINQNSHP